MKTFSLRTFMVCFLALASVLAYATTKARSIRLSRAVVNSLCELTGNPPFYKHVERSLFREIYFGGGAVTVSLGCETKIDDQWLSSFEGIVATSPGILKSITILNKDFPSEALSKQFPAIRISNCKLEQESKRLLAVKAVKKNRQAWMVLFFVLSPLAGFLIGKAYVMLRPCVSQSDDRNLGHAAS